MTYGEYQEVAAAAIARLLRNDAPVPEADRTLVLAARAQVVATLNERMDHLGAGRSRDEVSNRRSTHASVVLHPLHQLSRLIDDVETPAWGGAAPSDVLRSSEEPQRGVGECWRTAARGLFLATSELTRADRQPWLSHPEAGWPLVADLADVIEGLVLLDARLGDTGVLPVIPLQRTLAHLLVASDVGRLARLRRGDLVADGASAGSGVTSYAGGPAVVLVRSVGDFANAQRRLADLVRPVPNHLGLVAVEDRPGLRTARALAAGQAALNAAFVGWAQDAGCDELASAFDGRVRLYRRLHAASIRVVDTVPNRSTIPLIQQAEMSTQLRTLVPPTVSLRQVADLNGASATLAVALGKALRREGRHAGRIQALTAQGEGLPVPSRISNDRHPFHVACKALADSAQPQDVVASPPVRRARRELRVALDEATIRGQRPLRRMSPGMASAGRGMH
jgi:hypothetical protein